MSSNDDPVSRAETALEVYVGLLADKYAQTTPEFTVLADLLCDLQHWADNEGIPWQTALKQGARYHDEGREEGSAWSTRR